MATRRAFFGGLAAAASVAAAFRDDSLDRVLAAGSAADGRTPEDVAADDGYWDQIPPRPESCRRT